MGVLLTRIFRHSPAFLLRNDVGNLVISLLHPSTSCLVLMFGFCHKSRPIPCPRAFSL
jgi:hypothetical protein